MYLLLKHRSKRFKLITHILRLLTILVIANLESNIYVDTQMHNNLLDKHKPGVCLLCSVKYLVTHFDVSL